MHGHHGWGHHCGGGWGFGWFIPALLVGRLISESFERPQPGRPVAPPDVPPRPQPEPVAGPDAWAQSAAGPQSQALRRCLHCDQMVSVGFTFCPHCGKKLAPAACRYCGQSLRPEMSYCPHCGGPSRA
jgi:RNA polymerase subunit RPABC4/transcription elongation factor Spt4